MFAIFAAAIAVPGFLDGNELYNICRRSDMSECVYYVAGAKDMVSTLAPPEYVGRTICAPKGMESDQLVDVVVSYLVAHPERRHFTAATSVVNALEEAFPCKRVD